MAESATREEIIEELRRVSELLGKEHVSRLEFNRRSSIPASRVERVFGKWNAAIEAAGLIPRTRASKLSDKELEQEFRRVQGFLGKIPTVAEFRIHGRHSPTVYEKRFGRWSCTVDHYTGLGDATDKRKHEQPKRPHRRGTPRLPSGRAFGRPLNFRELRHEPTNEQGVVFLFGMVARELGFLVEAVAQGYPDCIAKRQIPGRPGHFEAVNIEFEFRSSRFNHDPSQCNLIVCWEHDWPDAPIEVIELKSVIKDLPQNVESI